MTNFLLEFDFAIIGASAALAGLIFIISKNALYRYRAGKKSRQEMTEYSLSLSLKIFTHVYMVSMLAVAVTMPILVYASWPRIRALSGEAAYLTSIALILFAIGGMLAFIFSLRKANLQVQNYIVVDFQSEPGLFTLVESLAYQADIENISEIRITPGAELDVVETADTFDDVFTGNRKFVQIGLSALKLLSAADLRVLLARQFALYAENQNPSLDFIKRLRTRFQTMSDRLMDAGFLLVMNPVAWMLLFSRPLVDVITNDYQVMAEFMADRAAARQFGSDRLAQALARYGVETVRYRELIDIVSAQSSRGLIYEGNIYDSMGRTYAESTDDLKIMVNHLFSDTSLAGGDIGRKTLKLRLKRLPETSEAADKGAAIPAMAFLADRHNTERRMMQILKR